MKTFVNIAVATLLLLLGGSTVSEQQKINLLLSFSGQYAESDFNITVNDGINREIFAPYAHLSIIYKGDQSYDYFIGPNPAELY
ncbi:MAG: hypothetical protein LBE37_07080 [Sphingobacterium sp.]|jgi:hypothetical protein|nr:hypothetical protein [Sphingobacterium sp.]